MKIYIRFLLFCALIAISGSIFCQTKNPDSLDIREIRRLVRDYEELQEDYEATNNLFIDLQRLNRQLMDINGMQDSVLVYQDRKISRLEIRITESYKARPKWYIWLGVIAGSITTGLLLERALIKGD